MHKNSKHIYIYISIIYFKPKLTFYIFLRVLKNFSFYVSSYQKQML